MAKRLTIKEINDIKQDAEAGLTQQEIADARGISRQTVNSAINNKIGDKQRQIADRYEYFCRDRVHLTGNFINSTPEMIFYDPVVEELEALEDIALHESTLINNDL